VSRATELGFEYPRHSAPALSQFPPVAVSALVHQCDMQLLTKWFTLITFLLPLATCSTACSRTIGEVSLPGPRTGCCIAIDRVMIAVGCCTVCWCTVGDRTMGPRSVSRSPVSDAVTVGSIWRRQTVLIWISVDCSSGHHAIGLWTILADAIRMFVRVRLHVIPIEYSQDSIGDLMGL
jgi:hypothetical protein